MTRNHLSSEPQTIITHLTETCFSLFPTNSQSSNLSQKNTNYAYNTCANKVLEKNLILFRKITESQNFAWQSITKKIFFSIWAISTQIHYAKKNNSD